MTTPKQTVRFKRPHVGQDPIFQCDSRFTVSSCGRRFGKTCIIPTVRRVELFDGLPGAYFAPTYKMLQEYWRETVDLLRPAISETNKAEHRIALKNGAIYDMWSLDSPDTVRGRKYAFADIDEAALIPDLLNIWNAVIRPTLTDYRGRAGFWSTPKGLNDFHILFSRGQDPEYAEWESFQFPTSSNPYIDPAEIEAARDELPQDTFRQEYLAEFIQGEGAVFRNITANLRKPELTPDSHAALQKKNDEVHTVVAGVDWGQVNDFTAISVACRNCRTELELDRFNKIDWHFQRERIETLFNKWGVSYAEVEENSIGSPNLQELQRQLPISLRGFQTTAQSKPQIIQSLALSLEKEELGLLDEAIATRELEAYEATRNPNTGRISYNAPKGLHDDTVIARALMVKAVIAPGSAGASTFRFKVI